MRYRLIRRKSDGKWLGLSLGIQEKWLVSKAGAWRFSETAALKPEDWLKRLRKASPKESYEVKETDNPGS